MATSITNISFEAAQIAQQSNEIALESGAQNIEDVKKRREQNRETVEQLQDESIVIEDKLARGDVGGFLGFFTKEDSMEADLIRMSANLARENEAIEDLSSRRADILDDMKASDSSTEQLQSGFEEIQQRTLDLFTSGRA